MKRAFLAVVVMALAWPGVAKADVTGLRNGTITAVATPAALTGKGCGTIVVATTATVATVGGRDVSATKGLKLCTDSAACDGVLAFLPVPPTAVWVHSATSAALRFVVFAECTGDTPAEPYVIAAGIATYVAGITEGTAIDVTGTPGPGWSPTVAWNSTEVNSTTWGDGTQATITITFNGTGTDPTFTAGNGTFSTVGSMDVTGSVTVGDTRVHGNPKTGLVLAPHQYSHEGYTVMLHINNGVIGTNLLNIGGGYGSAKAVTDIGFYTAGTWTTVAGTRWMSINPSGVVQTYGATVIGDASGDPLTIHSGAITYPNDVAHSCGGGVDAHNFCSGLLKLDDTNDIITAGGDILPGTTAATVYTPTTFTEADTVNAWGPGAAATITTSDGIPLFVWENPATGDVVVGKCDAVNCANLTATTVGARDVCANSEGNVQLYLAADGFPTVVWSTGCGASTAGAIKFRHCSNVSCTAFAAAEVTTGDIDAESVVGIARNAAGTLMGVAYMKTVAGAARGYYFRCDDPNSASPCATRTAENEVGRNAGGTAVDLYNTTWGGLSVDFDAADKPRVFYSTEAARLVHRNLCGDDECSSGGGYTVVSLAGGDNIRWPVVVKGTDGVITVSGPPAGDNAQVGRCGDLACTSATWTTITLANRAGHAVLSTLTGLPVVLFNGQGGARDASLYLCSNATCTGGTYYQVPAPYNAGNSTATPFTGAVMSAAGRIYWLYGYTGTYDAIVAQLDLGNPTITGVDIGNNTFKAATVTALGDITGRDHVATRDFYTGPRGVVRHYDADSSNYVGIASQATVPTNWTLYPPTTVASVANSVPVVGTDGIMAWSGATLTGSTLSLPTNEATLAACDETSAGTVVRYAKSNTVTTCVCNMTARGDAGYSGGWQVVGTTGDCT